jgi:hypothetical protein
MTCLYTFYKCKKEEVFEYKTVMKNFILRDKRGLYDYCFKKPELHKLFGQRDRSIGFLASDFFHQTASK